MLWSKPSWLSRDEKVGLEVIYSEEPPHREVTHLTTWKTPCTHITPSNPLATSMREDNHGGGLGYCECVGGWGKGWGALAPFSPLSPLLSRYTCLHLSRAWGGGKQSEMGDLQGSISKFVSSRIPNHNPIQDPLFSPSVFFPTGCPPRSHLFPHAWLPQHRTSGSLSQYLSCLRIRDLPSSLGFNTLSQISVACKGTAYQIYF